MPAARLGLPFARPHPPREYFAQYTCLKTVPFFLEFFDGEAVRKSEQKYSDVVLANELDEKPNILFGDELRSPAGVALILS